MKKRFAASYALLLTVALSAPVFANGGPDGIAFVQAPEQSDGVCSASSPEAAFACATEKCVAGGAEAADCLKIAWCLPQGWSADVFIQVEAGPHFHEYLCGWNSRETVEKAVAVKCDKTLRPELIECQAVRFFDPDGTEIPAE